MKCYIYILMWLYQLAFVFKSDTTKDSYLLITISKKNENMRRYLYIY